MRSSRGDAGSPARKPPPPIATMCPRMAPSSHDPPSRVAETARRLIQHLFSGPASCARITQMRYVYDFDEQAPGGRELLGGKGVGLAEMTELGVPVPAGFTITTDACRAYMAGGKQVPDGSRRRGGHAHRRPRGALGEALRRPVRPAARLRSLGRGDLDAGDDGHDPQPRPHGRRGRGPGGLDRKPAVRLRLLPAADPDVRGGRRRRRRAAIRRRDRRSQGPARRGERSRARAPTTCAS